MPFEENAELTRIPLLEEQLVIDKRVVETEKVRLTKTVEEFPQQLDVPLAVQTFHIERIRLDRPLDSLPEVRQEGATTIYPVVEEQLVVTKRLVLVEEVRVTLRTEEHHDTRTVTLHREKLVVEREPLR